ncbi:hypothetical protein K435DRAFT_797515 [Dendrothele bispora CBS 962.96]|uniref:Uncharacterized protein n=1 Tax=Dendrothele bispora (strain CBS 962.96) TaxID=1314807 RepID=A0A4S8M3B0_DENBC|nr:hypothetical protein K435DRAFT_797515 [Dendrothele bispora CBS 962.96]
MTSSRKRRVARRDALQLLHQEVPEIGASSSVASGSTFEPPLPSMVPETSPDQEVPQNQTQSRSIQEAGTMPLSSQLEQQDASPSRRDRYRLLPRSALPRRDPSSRFGRVFGSPRPSTSISPQRGNTTSLSATRSSSRRTAGSKSSSSRGTSASARPY